MPNAAPTMPRAPAPTIERSAANGSAGKPRSWRRSLAAPARSGALSISVPSRSNSTAPARARLIAAALKALSRFGARDEVVDAGVARQPVAPGDRVVLHALQLEHV